MSYRETVRQPGFQPFLWTQFLGAVNDNLFKIVVSMLAVSAAAPGMDGRALSLVGGLFVLPFLLFSGYAGQLADSYSKRTILVATKVLEVVVMALGMLALGAGYVSAAYAVLFLMALHSTFFSPAKYGLLPETLPDTHLSRANGLLEMSTFVAIVAGTAAGGYLFDVWRDRVWLVGALTLAIAIAGLTASFGIPRVPAAAPQQAFDWNPFGEIREGLARLWGDRVLWPTVVGLSYFWFLGALLQLVVILFGTHVMGLDDRWVGILMTSAAVGIGVGSIAAGRLSGGKVELGLVPIGAFGMGIFAIVLAFSGESFARASISLTLIGFSGGLFAVPLNALLQQRPDAAEKGRLIATNNFLNVAGILLASALLWIASRLRLSPDQILLAGGVLTLAGSVYVLARVPEFFVRFSLWLLTHTIYRIRIVGEENVPSRGPALLVCNHLSHIDGFLVGACVQRFVRFLVYRPYFEQPILRWWLSRMHAIPIDAGRDAVASLDRARKELEAGHVVCIFAEGQISRTANLLPFKRGLERIAGGLDVPIVPVYIDRVWGSIFSFERGRFFWKWPRHFPYAVTVAFGRTLPSSATAPEVRLAVMEVGCEVAGERHQAEETLALSFIRTARRRWGASCLADSTGRSLTFGRALVSSLLLGEWLRRHAPDQKNVGLLLPGSVGGALANVATAMAGKVAVNLNFTAGPESMAYAIERAEIRTILTSRRFLAKAEIEETEGMVMLEDLLTQFTTFAKLRMLVAARLLPVPVLIRRHAGRSQADQTAAIIFSSGSTGTPKGVQLTHRNVLANVHAIAQVFDMRHDDVMMGVLPFFHAFGYTGTLWFPLLTGFAAVYHPNPMDAKTIGDLTEHHKGTILMSTPTFCGSYVRKCEPAQFRTLRYAVVGAEKLRPAAADAFFEKFGVELLEGYGCTEMAPVVASNIPDVQDGRIRQRGRREGTVGHPLPGVAAKVVDPDTMAGPLFDREGLLLVKGASRMAGYLNDPDRTVEVIRDGWYITGDIASMDEEGFIRITDRLSRFSKLGGEMVPHLKIEESVGRLLREPHTCVVTAVPDESRGERLVVFFTDPLMTAPALWERLCQTDMPRLWLPKREDMHHIEAIPTLGTGKTDLRRVKQLAVEVTSSRQAFI